MSADANNTKVVVAALAGNTLIAISKFFAAFMTGSVATLAEAVHSVADSANQILLMMGLRRAGRRPTTLHPFGHSAEAYFWPFIVSIMIFLLGGAFALWKGAMSLLALMGGEVAAEHGSQFWSYLVLGLSIVFESYSFSVAWGELQKMRAGRPLREVLMLSKDPTIPVVLMEDTAALVGLVVAFISVGLTDLTGWAGCDAVGSLLIGVLLCVVAFVLANRTHSLLIGEAASQADRDRVREIAQDVSGVKQVTQLLSMHLGPREVLLALKVHFDRSLDLQGVEKAIDELEERVRSELPHMRFVFVEPDGDYRLELDPDRPVATKHQGA